MYFKNLFFLQAAGDEISVNKWKAELSHIYERINHFYLFLLSKWSKIF